MGTTIEYFDSDDNNSKVVGNLYPLPVKDDGLKLPDKAVNGTPDYGGAVAGDFACLSLSGLTTLKKIFFYNYNGAGHTARVKWGDGGNTLFTLSDGGHIIIDFTGDPVNFYIDGTDVAGGAQPTVTYLGVE